MFHDRIAAYPPPSASPPAGQRSYSPAPKRPNHLAPGPSRPSYNPRSSSLSLISRANSSSSSLPGSSRAPNGSALRQELTPPPFVDDPLDVLVKIIGVPLPKDALDDQDVQVKQPAQLTEDIDFDGLSLQQFVYEADRQKLSAQSQPEEYTAQSVEECEYVHRNMLVWGHIDYGTR